MSQLRQQELQFDRLDVQVCVVTFDDGFLARKYVEQSQLSWPLLIDDDRQLYQAYGMERGSAWSIYGPSSIWHYLQRMMCGHMPGRPGSDFRQLGGNVLIDASGIVQLHYVSDSPHDRPSVDAILGIVNSQQATT